MNAIMQCAVTPNFILLILYMNIQQEHIDLKKAIFIESSKAIFIALNKKKE